MGVKVVATGSYIQWSQPVKLHAPLASSSIDCPTSNRVVSCRYVHNTKVLEPSALFVTASSKLHRSRSCDANKLTTRISCSASFDFDAYDDQDFSQTDSELAQWFRLSDHNAARNSFNGPDSESESETNLDFPGNNSTGSAENRNGLESLRSMELQEWPNSIERKANSIELSISLPMIKRKMQREDGFREAEVSAYCSMKKAFSSMVFIIRELHSYTLQMREILFTEDLQGIISRVEQEIHASFGWLFRQVFSQTPTLMVYTMILLANFTVYSMGSNLAIAAQLTPVEIASTIEFHDQNGQKFSSSALKTFTRFSSHGKSTSIGGNNGGHGGKIRPAASGMDGDGWFEQFRTIFPDATSPLGTTREAEWISGQVSAEEELSLWNSIVKEASTMNPVLRDESLDHETMQRFVSPVKAEIELENYAEYLRTELLYQTLLSQDPNNPLLLANYAQFLCLVTHDYDRAEEYFKRAIKSEGADAEAYNKYASFLWKKREDLLAAEETFLEAMAADPTNSYYAANYAHFLWNTGGEDTCFPLDSSSDDNSQQV